MYFINTFTKYYKNFLIFKKKTCNISYAWYIIITIQYFNR